MRRREISATRPLVVLMSFREPRATTNPYIIQLRDALTALPDVTVLPFSYRAAFTARVDVFHAHWPETLVSGRSRVKDAVRQSLYLLFLLRLAVTRTPVVRTQHNLGLPSGLRRTQIGLLRLTERRTRAVVVLNPCTPVPAGRERALVPHGHYRNWFAPCPRPPRVPGRVVCVGLVRRYKWIDELVRAFAATAGHAGADALTLRISGRPSAPELADDLRDLAAPDHRISLRLEFLTDAEVVAELGAAELVVLPYRFMHNSGSILAALSVGTPVLVPGNEVNRLLAEEVGPGWVHTFDDAVGPEVLLSTLDSLRADPPRNPPDLSNRGWESVGAAHRDLYLRTPR